MRQPQLIQTFCSSSLPLFLSGTKTQHLEMKEPSWYQNDESCLLNMQYQRRETWVYENFCEQLYHPWTSYFLILFQQNKIKSLFTQPAVVRIQLYEIKCYMKDFPIPFNVYLGQLLHLNRRPHHFRLTQKLSHIFSLCVNILIFFFNFSHTEKNYPSLDTTSPTRYVLIYLIISVEKFKKKLLLLSISSSSPSCLSKGQHKEALVLHTLSHFL